MAVNGATLVSFGSGGLEIGDVVCSASPLSTPGYLPLNNEAATYLSSSYPALAAKYADKTVAFSTSTSSDTIYDRFSYTGKTFLGQNSYNSDGTFSTSVDGVTWNRFGISTPSFDTTNRGANRFYQIAYGNGRIVALYTPNSTFVDTIKAAPYYGSYNWGANMVSSDGGLTWQLGNLNPLISSTGNSTAAWRQIIFNGIYFLATAVSYYSAYYYTMYSISYDGISWSEPATLSYIVNSPPNYQILVPGATGNFIYIEGDLVNGQVAARYNIGGQGSGFTSKVPISGAYGADLYVVLCNNSGPSQTSVPTNTYFTSPTGLTWTARTLPATLFWQSIAYTGGYFLAIGSSNSGATSTAYTSTDGINWTAQTVPLISQGTSGTIGTIAGGNGKFIYYNPYSGSTVTVNLSTAGSTFTLPFVRAPLGTQAYIKAT